MIVNGRQYALSERKLRKCIAMRRKLLRKLSAALNTTATQQEIEVLQEQMESMTKEMNEYRALRTGRIEPPDLSEIKHLPQNLIRLRIAVGWSQQDLARQSRVSPSLVHRWESTAYKVVSLSRVLAVADLLNSALQQQERPLDLIGQPLTFTADWFNSDGHG
jgi:HTH-type transcriptional regulator/antitoxin HigA